MLALFLSRSPRAVAIVMQKPKQEKKAKGGKL